MNNEEQQEQQRRINEEELRELAHYYGGFSELRKVIDELEKQYWEKGYERAYRQ